jgi:hypothetical protein
MTLKVKKEEEDIADEVFCVGSASWMDSSAGAKDSVSSVARRIGGVGMKSVDTDSAKMAAERCGNEEEVAAAEDVLDLISL